MMKKFTQINEGNRLKDELNKWSIKESLITILELFKDITDTKNDFFNIIDEQFIQEADNETNSYEDYERLTDIIDFDPDPKIFEEILSILLNNEPIIGENFAHPYLDWLYLYHVVYPKLPDNNKIFKKINEE